MLNRRKDYACALVALAVPFLFLFRYVSASSPYSRFIGNDFEYLYYNFKLYLLSSLSQHRIPLWSPSEGCGYPFYSNPFTQTFYPINLPLWLYQELSGGYSILDHQRFTVLGISLFGLGLYLWLRSLGTLPRHALFAATLISVSYKITELVRFTNAAHTAAWMPFILWGCTLATRKGSEIKGGIIIAASTLMMLTGGYLYYVYYSAFLIPPYLALLIFPATRHALVRPSADLNLRKYGLTLFAAFAAPVIICAPYLAKVSQLLAQTSDRGGRNFAYSTAHEFTVLDNIGSLIYPPAAQAEGWYHFGFIGLMLILFHGIHTLTAASDKRETLLLCALLTWIAVVMYITYGKYSYLFKLLWDYLPGFASLRVWGRLNIVLLPLFALLLARACGSFERHLTGTEVPHDRAVIRTKRTSLLLLAAYFAMLATQIFLYRHRDLADVYWTRYIRPALGPDFDEISFITNGAVAATLLIATLIIARRRDLRTKGTLIALWTCLAVVNIFDVSTVAPKQWSYPGLIGTTKNRLDIKATDVKSLSSERVYDHSTVKFGPRFSAGYVESWHYGRFVHFLTEHGDSPVDDLSLEHKPDAFKRLLALEGNQRFYFSTAINYSEISDFLDDADEHTTDSEFHLKIKEYHGDYLKAAVATQQSGYLSFIDNWDEDWIALVNGEPAEIELLFGTFKTVAVNKDATAIELIYNPFG